jgi:hypothetical protein
MRLYERMARTEMAIHLAVIFGIGTATFVFVLIGALEAAVIAMVCLMIVLASRSIQVRQIERRKRAAAILSHHERMRRPLGL